MKIDLSQLPGAVKRSASKIALAGGRALLVGGAVIDLLEGREAKDWDLEVFGLSYSKLEEIFSDANPKTVGRQFGVLKINFGDVDLDLNVPRRDNKVGTGHTGFEVECDPSMSLKEAALRRDFSIDSAAVEIYTGELHDFFGGMADLQQGCLRAVDAALFVEDPLRALRAMQLLARKATFVDESTMHLIRGMSDTFPELAPERVHVEWQKLLLKADKPSVGLNFLRESGWLKWFPELEALIGCEQNPDWHPEGDVWVHSLLVMDAAAEVRHNVPERFQEALLFGTLLHDVGKPEKTVTPEMVAADEAPASMLWTAHGHDKAGEAPAVTFMERMTNNKKLIRMVEAIVGLHMQPHNLRAGEAKQGGYLRLHKKLEAVGADLSLIGYMCQCDACGSSADWKERSLASGEPNWEHLSSERPVLLRETPDAAVLLPQDAVSAQVLDAQVLKGLEVRGRKDGLLRLLLKLLDAVFKFHSICLLTAQKHLLRLQKPPFRRRDENRRPPQPP